MGNELELQPEQEINDDVICSGDCDNCVDSVCEDEEVNDYYVSAFNQVMAILDTVFANETSVDYLTFLQAIKDHVDEEIDTTENEIALEEEESAEGEEKEESAE